MNWIKRFKNWVKFKYEVNQWNVEDLKRDNDRLREQLRNQDDMKRGIRMSIRSKEDPSFGLRGYDKTTTWETAYPDESLDEIIDGFVTCMIGMTWSKDVVLQGLKEYVEDRYDTKED